MHDAVLKILEVLEGFGAKLLGLGMHPTLSLKEAQVWSHRDRKIYQALDRLFNIKQHGWLNIQSFQLNLPYRNEHEAVKLYNKLVEILPYIPAISASSPIYDSTFGKFVDNRLHFYKINQQRIPSITGNIVPERINSFEEYRDLTIRKYSADLKRAGAPTSLLNKEWINSRGAVIRFSRKAIEIRIMDEQECIKSSVALSCFIRSLLRGIILSEYPRYPQNNLVQDLNSIISNGLNAKVRNNSSTARDVCKELYSIAYENANEQEKPYLRLVLKRIKEGNISELISNDIKRRAKKTDLKEAILGVYLNLTENLAKNKIYT
jgi:gamma-glutamyl:cysteine ligase YbdK (ATP-grasp superfamily)